MRSSREEERKLTAEAIGGAVLTSFVDRDCEEENATESDSESIAAPKRCTQEKEKDVIAFWVMREVCSAQKADK
jgi:hypothetical protein